MQIPDQARLQLGLAPARPVDINVDLAGPWYLPEEQADAGAAGTAQPGQVHLAICGSRAPDTDASVIDALHGS
ncbi:hypothetical protein [Actinomadura rudentiformis]|uniref:Uncharacterized protein n=1 Tax=Actinomadura rudentiformis TaxID=359158 RepID=A0A6H9YG83_9ACTN|nr:hypothetical protein [Actinomadura rudentiformis]KAB2340876.1 hypothetical protein F8566_43985 [Actinomadura rudentiformis]